MGTIIKQTSQKTYWYSWVAVGAALLLLGFLLAWISNRFSALTDWRAFVTMTLLCGLLFGGVWRLLKPEKPPSWLLKLTIATVLLHLVVSVFWLVALPRWGHGTPPERAGYVMGDAYARDTLAWRLARSPKPLTTAFVDNRKADQYGGMLFISAGIYRHFGLEKHQPLLILILAATVSALAVPFTWAFARRAWGEKQAHLAAWVMLLTPEAVLLGSSQMREAFTMALAIAAFYGLMRYTQERSWAGLAWTLAPLALCIPFSPPVAAMTLAMAALLAGGLHFSRRGQPVGRRKLWLGLAILIVIVLIGLYFVLKQFTPPGMINPLEMVRWWFTKSAQLQMYISQHASGWMQKVFKAYPAWVELPVLVGYGIVQPFLPAALVAGSAAPIWQAIAVWRALGWTILLAFMVYAPLLALRSERKSIFTLTLSLVVWLVILIASVRAGGDMWDNPRYRATFVGLQAALAAWAWVEHRRAADPLFRRALLLVGAMLGWFLPWYLRRYTPLSWPVVDLFKTLGMGAATAFLLILWDWARTAAAVQPNEAPLPLAQSFADPPSVSGND
jgi:hypothetical protein